MDAPEFSLRLATVHEAAEIACLSRELVEAGLPWAWRPERVAASVRSARANVVVARAANEIAGFGIMRYGDDEAHLDLLAVDPTCRRQGLGRQLIRWLEAPAIAGGIASVTLEVRAWNHGAQAFYERLGYRKLGRVAGYYQGRESAMRMKRELSHEPNPVDGR